MNKMKKEKGFRDGIKKEEILHLTPEEKQFVSAKREFDSEVINENVKSFLIESEQSMINYSKVRFECGELTESILKANNRMNEFKQDILIGRTEKKWQDLGTPMTIDDLKIEVMKLNRLCSMTLLSLKQNLVKLWNYVGAIKLDGKPILTEDKYNEFVKNVAENLSTTSYKIKTYE